MGLRVRSTAAEASDSCTHTASDAACSDGQHCNGSELCGATQGCQPGTPPNCNDLIVCTTDSCNEATDTCDHKPVNSACSDALFCNGQEVCMVGVGCQAASPPNCNDGVPCTLDSCNENAKSCLNARQNSQCDDGLFCNGAETCDTVDGCQPGTPPNCNDQVGCTVDACNESSRSCVNTPQNRLCDDGPYCTGKETCKPGIGCIKGLAPHCDDSNPCTHDSCNETNDKCQHFQSPLICDDGIVCTEDACTPSGCTHLDSCGACCMRTGNCVDGIDFLECMSLPGETTFLGVGSVCLGDANHDGVDDCCGVRDEIPAVSEWGLVVLPCC